jgi:hypothetical protein
MVILLPRDVQNFSSKEKPDFVADLYCRGSAANVTVLCKENGMIEADLSLKVKELKMVNAIFYARNVLFNISVDKLS